VHLYFIENGQAQVALGDLHMSNAWSLRRRRCILTGCYREEKQPPDSLKL
jgi:hypothetical protein